MKLTIFDLDNWREIGMTLARNKTRTFLTAFGVFWGTAMLGMLWGGASGLRGMMMREVYGLSTNMACFMPRPTTMPYKGYAKGLSWSLTDADIEAFDRTVPNIDMRSVVDFRSGSVAYGSKSTTPGNILGIYEDFLKMQLPIVKAGRLINASDERNSAKVVVIGSSIADDIFQSDYEGAIGKNLIVKGVPMQVVGVVEQVGDGSIVGNMERNVMMPNSTLNNAFPSYRSTKSHDFFIFTVLPGHRPSELQPYILQALRSNHPIHPEDINAFYFMDISQMFETIESIFLGITLLAFFVGLGTLIAGIIGVGNIMWIIVKERTSEIGIRRAIGAKPIDIIVQVLSEGFMLTAIAGTAGITFATLVLAIADHVTSSPIVGEAGFLLSFSNAITIMLIFLILGTAAGLVPAIKAMKIKPIEAINTR